MKPIDFSDKFATHFDNASIADALKAPGRKEFESRHTQNEQTTIVKRMMLMMWVALLQKAANVRGTPSGRILLTPEYMPTNVSGDEDASLYVADRKNVRSWPQHMRTGLNLVNIDLHDQDIADVWSLFFVNWTGELFVTFSGNVMEGGVDLFEDETRIFALAIDSEGISTLRWRARPATTELTATA